ncbi:DUF2339 domain-containing protein [Rhodobacteraceae bacterium 2CG4]|uniref:DUF2339 domain-containing protein n=1 Tax=Halovulum marinum TaxID=2662447 RepID=A0A6L5Z6P9_9RHOB|nr:DUF2339 domain-containing protein [Halovulum marinum]MSU92231.1 DUF2339 domain-containing protein [Halovulum marinum]
MGFILGLLALTYGLGLPVAVIFLLVRSADLQRRVQGLERARPASGAPQPAAPRAPAAPPRPSADDLAPLPQDRPFIPETAPPPSAAPPPAAAPPEGDATAPGAEPGAASGASPRPPRAFVFRQQRLHEAGHWLRANWFLAVAALSLALAGVFLVQYGIETGLLTPWMRVLGAVALGLALIGAGEWMRRRGAEDDHATAFVPQTFAGAGLVSVFVGVLAARQLYGLIGAEAAFAGLALTGAGALLLGWYHGPFLTCVGLLGAFAAPFLVGGEAEDPSWLHGYFALVTVVGLGIDAARRWAWVSVLALGLGFAAAGLLALAQGGGAAQLGFALVAAGAAAAVPVWRVVPDQRGETVSGSLLRLARRARPRWPEFPTRLAFGAMAAASAVAVWVAGEGPAEFWAACAALGALYLLAALWLRHAPALADLPALPVLGFWAVLVLQALDRGAVFRSFTGWSLPQADAEALPPASVTILAAGALTASLVAGWRAAAPGRAAVPWAFGAALAGPVALVLLEALWQPAAVLGGYPWALHAVAAAVLLTVLAERHARAQGGPGLGVAVLAIAAMTMLSLGAVVVFTKAALTVALAVMVLASALLDRRFDLPQLGAFTALGVIVAGWRLVLDPGVAWALDAPLAAVLLAYGGVLAMFAGALWAVRQRQRVRQAVYLESGLWLAGGVFVSVLLARGLGEDGFWIAGLYGTVWLVVALGQVHRAGLGGALRWLRLGLAALAGLVAAAAFGVTLTLLHPVWGVFPEPVPGPWLLNPLLVAFALPALVLLAGAHWLRELPRPLRGALAGLGAAMLAHWLALEIRHLWRGPRMDQPGVTDPELYSYTVALLLTAAALMAAAWARRSAVLRRLALGAVGLTVAKVFLVDMAGLTGLIRVVSFLGLGLSLAGLAMLNRWMEAAFAAPPPQAPPGGAAPPPETGVDGP